MLKRAQAIADQIVDWRRYVHQHPELSFQEVETARFVAQRLQEMGIAGVDSALAKMDQEDLLALARGMEALLRAMY